ncbi:uncharacterized protein FA14DRAFT_177627 [Meira miltonrushii]|uniref:Uncharacterized protein n=1 Tax=Meira miltonrushii TaxID=1280837 RepID=A0A316VM40_9BASI|nr:uncharacterized protein FA14DRAFT_177627 [Meira miltonrushii]PWN38354.1 hypothetical protein FA14DRAFT_177627 [Meira miltonrushii]
MDSNDRRHNIRGSSITLPGPEEDATPCVIRCYVSRSSSFRLLGEFELDYRPLYEEFKLYVWRTITLREIATLLFIRDCSFNPSPLSLHAFRIIRFDERNGYFFAEKAFYDITRISSVQFSVAKKEVRQLLFGEDILEANSTFEKVMQEFTPQLPKGANEDAAKETLDSIGWRDGDILDCILYEPSNEPDRRRYQKQERGSNDQSHRSRRNRHQSRDEEAMNRRSSEHHRNGRRSPSPRWEQRSRRDSTYSNRRSASPSRGDVS